MGINFGKFEKQADFLDLDPLGNRAAEDAKDAAKAQAEATRRSVEEEARQFDETQAMLKPYHEIGQSQLPALQSGATSGGYMNAIDMLLNNPNAITDSRNAEAQRYANQMGINRDLSGIGNFKPNEAMSIEDMLNQRKQGLAGVGMTTGENIARFGQNNAASLGALVERNAANQAQGILNAQNASTSGMNNMVALGGAFGNYMSGRQPRTNNQGFVDSSGTGYFKPGGGMSIFE